MDKRLSIIKEAHAKYVEWWMPIDLACNSCMCAMCCHRFCETLLTRDDKWWNTWLGDVIPEEKKQPFKVHILKLVVCHYGKIIDLNENE
jgi:hypothetical protein